MNFIEHLALASPWWTDPGWDKNDRSIVSALKSGIKFRHIRQHRLKYPSLEIIRGPRQVGKTTEIKMIINDLLAQGKNPKSIGYFTCDVISKYKELFEILKTFSQHLKLNKIKTGALFLDEVSSIKEWQRAVKGFVDTGLGKNIHLIVTGSSSIELKRGYERMPGRRNGGKDYLFLPVNFGEFCSLTNSGRVIRREKFRNLLKSPGKFAKFKEDVLIDAAFYRKCLRDYMKTGGFPRAISDLLKYGDISDETLFIYQSVLFSEFEKYKKSIATLIQIITELVKNIATPLSFNAIMKNTGLSSADTVKEYIEMFSRSYLGLQLFCVDISKKRAFNKKNKKMYFIDPVIFRILQGKFQDPFPPDSNLAENLAAVQTGRFFLNEWANTGMLNSLFYWKSAKGNEVDFVIYLDGKPFGLEVKYKDIVSKWDEISIRKGIGKGIIITKDSFEWGEIPKIPLWAFLLLDVGNMGSREIRQIRRNAQKRIRAVYGET